MRVLVWMMAVLAALLGTPALAQVTVIHAGSVIRDADGEPSGPATITIEDGRIVSIVDGLQTPGGEALVIDNGWLERECDPAFVSDRSDGKIAHLDGLNLSRAWAWRELGDEVTAQRHLDAALPHVTGDYMGEHWLASFALLALRARA